MKTIVEEFSERLKYSMDFRGINQKKLAELCKLSEKVISKYIRGEREPLMSSLIALATGLGCSVDYLCGLSDHE